MAGVYYKGSVIVFQLNDKYSLGVFDDLVASGKLDAYVNEAFIEKVRKDSIDNIPTHTSDKDISKLLEMVTEIKDKLDKGVVTTQIPNSQNEKPDYSFKPVITESSAQPSGGNVSPASVSDSKTEESKDVAPKKKKKKSAFSGMDMSSIMARAASMDGGKK